jgi:ABC-2 type transport system permease protein
MNILHLMLKDLAIFFRDRGSIFYLFVLPVVFILIFTGLVGATVSEQQADDEISSEEDAVAITVVNFDTAGLLAGNLIKQIDAAPGYQAQQMSEQDAQRLLDNATIGWYLSIPAGFSTRVAAGEPVTLHLLFHPDAYRPNLEGVQRLLVAIARDISIEQRLLAGLRQMGEMQRADPQTASAFNPSKLIAQARSQSQSSSSRPLVAVVQTNPASSLEPGVEFNPLMAYVSGFAVLFVFLSAQVTARSFFDEQKSGSFRRLLAAPLHKSELLGGKLLPNFLLTCVQIAAIFLVGYLILPLIGLGKVSVGAHPEAWVVVSLAIALCSTSLGIFIVAFARTEAQVSGLSTAILWVAGILSGSFFPASMMPTFLTSIGRFFPHYYANQAYYDVLARGYGLPQVWSPVLLLLVFTGIFFVIGLLKFDFE